MSMLCPIWSTSAKGVAGYVGLGLAIDSPRAGGAYRLTSTADAQLPNLSAQNRKLLTSWLVVQRRAGVNLPQITSDVLDNIKNRAPLKFSQRVDAALTYIASRIRTLDAKINFNVPVPDNRFLELMAATETESPEEAFYLLKILRDMHLLDGQLVVTGGNFGIAPAGWSRIEELSSKGPLTPQAFVAMWFDASMDEPYTLGIAPAIEANGYTPLRIDNKHHVNKIDDEIIAEIRKSSFLVADFTCAKGQVRGGVYYEAGFAMGLRIPVIWACKVTSIDDLHFDTRQYSHIAWKDEADLKQQLTSRIGAVVGPLIIS
jgi:hypothetical protein